MTQIVKIMFSATTILLPKSNISPTLAQYFVYIVITILRGFSINKCIANREMDNSSNPYLAL